MHARELIRKAVATAITGLATTGTRVFTNRVYPFRESDLPNVSVYVARNPETVEQYANSDIQLRTLPVDVVARVKAGSLLDDTLDDICSEVEAAIMGNAVLAGLVKDVTLSSTEIGFDDEGDVPVGTATMEWTVWYLVDGSAPNAPVSD